MFDWWQKQFTEDMIKLIMVIIAVLTMYHFL